LKHIYDSAQIDAYAFEKFCYLPSKPVAEESIKELTLKIGLLFPIL
jgi:hypothetical protein